MMFTVVTLQWIPNKSNDSFAAVTISKFLEEHKELHMLKQQEEQQTQGL
jgi:hypothetical protein